MTGWTGLRNRYYGLRHGESEANAAGLIVSDPRIGCAAYGLTDTGRAQVTASVRAAAEGGALRTPLLWAVSDFLRTRETAEAARAAHPSGGAWQTSLSLRERYFGAFDQRSNTHYPAVWTLDAQDPNHTTDDVEPVSAVAARVHALLQVLEAAHTDTTIVFVSHGDTLQISLAAFEGRPLTAHRDCPPWQPGELRSLSPRSPQ